MLDMYDAKPASPVAFSMAARFSSMKADVESAPNLERESPSHPHTIERCDERA